MKPGRTPNVMILVGSNNISRSSDEEEAQCESMMVCLFTTLWQRFNCAVLTVCTVPMSTKTLTATGRRHNEGVIRWKKILRNLASRNAGRMILTDIQHELRAMDQARLTTDGIHFDCIEGQAWLSRVFQEQLDEMEVELFDTGVLKKEETSNKPAISTFVPPNLETRLGTVPAVTTYRPQSSSEPGQRTDVQDRLGEAPTRRTINPRRRLGPVNPRAETTSTSRSDTISETTRTSRDERRPNRSSLMWSRPIPSPWHMYKGGSDEIEPSDNEICSRCHKGVEWSEFVCQRTVLDNRCGLVKSCWHKLQLYNCLEVHRLRRTALEQYNGSSECKTVTRRETES